MIGASSPMLLVLVPLLCGMATPPVQGQLLFNIRGVFTPNSYVYEYGEFILNLGPRYDGSGDIIRRISGRERLRTCSDVSPFEELIAGGCWKLLEFRAFFSICGSQGVYVPAPRGPYYNVFCGPDFQVPGATGLSTEATNTEATLTTEATATEATTTEATTTEATTTEATTTPCVLPTGPSALAAGADLA